MLILNEYLSIHKYKYKLLLYVVLMRTNNENNYNDYLKVISYI